MRSCTSCLWRLVVTILQTILSLGLLAVVVFVVYTLSQSSTTTTTYQPPPEVAQQPANPPASVQEGKLLPVLLPSGPEKYIPNNVENYSQADGDTIVRAVEGINQLGDIMTAVGVHDAPGLSGAGATVFNLLACYQKENIIKWRAYGKLGDDPALGVIIAADYEQLGNRENLLTCMDPFRPSKFADSGGYKAQSNIRFEPCAGQYWLKDGAKKYAIAYAATNVTTCEDLCDHLSECQAGHTTKVYPKNAQ